ncbi:MAG: hypothetical protein QOJ63_449 [Solirubrobacteraceae bacterium]|nr:hypothetical protein [Solirubrobacteraceae bacterium]
MPRFVAHGQNWEDVRLRRIFGDRRCGLYLDIGAGHPTFHSFTYTLHLQGWRGINVEPLPSFFDLLVAQRPSDVNINAVLGRQGGETLRFYEVPEQRGSSTLVAAVADDMRAQGWEVVEHDVPMLTLAQVCERHARGPIDLLKVDVEGAEADVLHGNDWERFRPRLIVVETNAPQTWEPLLLDNGYERAADDGVNTWYVEGAEQQWIELLAPPVSTLDHFVPFEILRELGAPEPPPPRPVTSIGSGPRPRVLLVLSSSNQLYSGTGRVIFETLGRLAGELALEVAIDDADPRNVGLATAFCSAHGLRLHLGPGERLAGAPDAGNAGLADLLDSDAWDIVMAVSWANAATNRTLLEHVGNTALAYLPLHQPSWTVALDEGGRKLVGEVYREMLLRADLVLCISPWERWAIGDIVWPGSASCAVVAPGCDFSQFVPGPATRGRDLLFVGDFREPRKRFDRVVDVFAHVRAADAGARLLVVGNESERAAAELAPGLADAVVSLGYLPEAKLREAYAGAAVLLLLSEYEAYGLPVIEALASATPVVMSEQPAPRSLFGRLDGVHFVDGDDSAAAARVVSALLAEGPSVHRRLAAAQPHVAELFDWKHSARRTLDHLLAAWARRTRSTTGFLPTADSIR